MSAKNEVIAAIFKWCGWYESAETIAERLPFCPVQDTAILSEMLEHGGVLHFNVSEFGPLPERGWLKRVFLLALIADWLRIATGRPLNTRSWYRPTGGAERSMHKLALAVDLAPDDDEHLVSLLRCATLLQDLQPALRLAIGVGANTLHIAALRTPAHRAAYCYKGLLQTQQLMNAVASILPSALEHVE